MIDRLSFVILLRLLCHTHFMFLLYFLYLYWDILDFNMHLWRLWIGLNFDILGPAYFLTKIDVIFEAIDCDIWCLGVDLLRNFLEVSCDIYLWWSLLLITLLKLSFGV